MILVVCGPTGVGKTLLSEELAEKFNAIIINADAVQLYKDLNIGSAKITAEEMKDVSHYLFDFLKVTEDYTVFNYQKDVRKIINDNKNKNIIIVGGTGLYISAALFDYTFDNDGAKDYSNLSDTQVYELAIKKDSSMDIHKNNRVRLEKFLSRTNKNKNGNKLLYDTLFIGLTTPRDNLYQKINLRVDNMINSGLIEEVEALKCYKEKSRVLNSAIGYKEVLSYLDKNISKEEMIELIKKNSRHYAKRQYTWFNNKMDVNWFNVNYNNFNETIEDVEKFIKKVVK